MKRPLIAYIILILTISLGIFSMFYVKENCNIILGKMDKAVLSIKDNNFKETKKSLEDAQKFFHVKEKTFNIIIGQSLTEKINDNLRKALFYSDLKLKGHTIFYIEEAIDEITKAIDSNEFNFDTVF